jgi:hypothetical protein
MTLGKYTIVLPAVLLMLCGMTAAHAIEPQLEACIRQNAPQSTAVQQIEMRSTDRAGYEKTLVADIYLKRFQNGTSGLIAYFREPLDIIGTRLLVIEKPPENEMYMYMPSLFKIRRISSKSISSSMYGSDFSYEDIERFYGMLSTEQPVQAPDTELDGHPVYVLKSQPADASGSRYETITAYFGRQDCVVRQVDFYEPGARLRKRLVADPGSITTVGNIRLPLEFTMSDLKNRTETRLSISKMELDIPLDDATFDPGQLKEFRGIR